MLKIPFDTNLLKLYNQQHNRYKFTIYSTLILLLFWFLKHFCMELLFVFIWSKANKNIDSYKWHVQYMFILQTNYGIVVSRSIKIKNRICLRIQQRKKFLMVTFEEWCFTFSTDWLVPIIYRFTVSSSG